MKSLRLPISLPLLLPLLVSAYGQQLDVKPSAVRMLDLDGDGQLDKLYLGADGSLRVALHNGARSYLEVEQELPRVNVKDVLALDLNGDAALDLFLVAAGINVVLAGDGTGRFRDVTLELGLLDAGEGLSIERLDLDDDGRPDLLLHNATHDVIFWARVEGGFERDPEAIVVQLNPNQMPVLLPGAPAAAVPAEKPGKGSELETKDGTRTFQEGQPGSVRTQMESTNEIRQALGPRTFTPQALTTPVGIVQGSGTVGMLPKWIGSKKLGDSVLSESAGNLGVGTPSPAAKLDVAGAVAVNGSAVIDAAGQWVGDPTGLVGPTGPTGPMGSPGVVSFGLGNTRGGTDALLSNTSGHRNTAFGVDALMSNTAGYQNTASGNKALRNNTSGSYNTATGVDALLGNTTGYFNTATGVNALTDNTTGSSNTATGESALRSNTTGIRNSATGTSALRYNTTGYDNSATGVNALVNNTTGFSNSATGKGALFSNTTGNKNTASGVDALYSNTSGFENAASGVDALFGNTTGFQNTASGSNALNLNTTGRLNTASGSRALRNNTTGIHNTAMGGFALANNTIGQGNIAIGIYSGYYPTTGSRNIMIGNYGVASDTGTIRIGTSVNQARTFLAAVRGVTTGMANAIPVLVDSTGQLGTVSSSRRFKEDIHDMGAATDRLLDLRPVLFRYKQEQGMPAGQELVPEYGLIAEEVAEIFPDLVVYDDEKKPFTVKYHLLSSMLLNELKKERERNLARDVELDARLSALEQRE